MTPQTHTIRLQSGEIGEVATMLKPRELVGRKVLASVEIDGEFKKISGVVDYVVTQGEIEF
jgi:hypothetical protein